VLVTSVDVTGEFLVQDMTPNFMEIRPNGDKFFWVSVRPTMPGARQGTIVLQTQDHGALPALPLTGTRQE
jgi:hypothetical protein